MDSMSSYSVEYLTRLLKAVEDFEGAFDAWMATQVESDHLSSRGLFPTVWTDEDAEPSEVQPLELEVARTAGLASVAVSVTGSYIVVAGLGALDPIANWSILSSPKAPLTARDVRTTTASVKGRLEGMIADSGDNDHGGRPAFSPAQLHPVVWSGAAAHWTTHQYRVAVREAAEALTQHWKVLLERTDVDDSVFWQQTLATGSSQPTRPRLVWPGDPTDKTVKSMRGGIGPVTLGLQGLASGLTLTVRNPTTHKRDELSEQEAMERLAAYSFLARLLDQCEVVPSAPSE